MGKPFLLRNERGKHAAHAGHRILEFRQRPDARLPLSHPERSFQLQRTDPSLITAVLRHGTWGTLPETPPGRVFVPVSDADATVTYYLVCKAEHKKDFHALFAEL